MYASCAASHAPILSDPFTTEVYARVDAVAVAEAKTTLDLCEVIVTFNASGLRGGGARGQGDVDVLEVFAARDEVMESSMDRVAARCQVDATQADLVAGINFWESKGDNGLRCLQKGATPQRHS